MLGITQKKGNDERLCGRMIAYARILPNPDKSEGMETPFDEMIKNGLLVLEGDFKSALEAAPSKKLLNQEVDEKIDHLIASMESEGMEIPEEVNVEALRDRLHELSSMEVIPIPAKIGAFENEAQILEQDADIYYIGEFIGVNQAHFCLTSLPIFYQAKYREQAKAEEIALLNDVLSQFENGDFVDTEDLQEETDNLFPEGVTLNSFVGDLSKLLNTRVIPFLLACESDSDYQIQIDKFYNFMKSYPNPADLALVDKAIRDLRKQGDQMTARKLLELSCQKIAAVYNENTKAAEELDQEISKI